MSSSKSQPSISSRHSTHRNVHEQDIELGDLSVHRDHEATIPLIDDLQESFGDPDDLPSSSKTPKKPLQKLAHSRTKRWQLVLFEKAQWVLSHILMLLGFYQAILISWSLLDGLCPDDAKSVRAAFGLDNRFHKDTSSIPDTVFPIACHSHNDYWRVRPFYTAIEMGCSSVEADIWLHNGDLLIGHTKPSTSPGHTLRAMYLLPILKILDSRNLAALKGGEHEDSERVGIFNSDPEQSLVLLIDFKVDGAAIWPVLQRELEPLRQRRYLTHFDGSSVVPGPITVVASGDVSFEDVVRNTTYRDVFYDAPLDVMGARAPALLDLDYDEQPDEDHHNPEDYVSEEDEEVEVEVEEEYSKTRDTNSTISERSRIPANAAIYSPVNSYYASVSFSRSIGRPIHSSLSHAQIELIRSQIYGAHARGLKVRYWGVPSWPIGVRNYLWRVLVREGADVLSVDDVEAVTRGDWGPKKGGWERKWWP